MEIRDDNDWSSDEDLPEDDGYSPSRSPLSPSRMSTQPLLSPKRISQIREEWSWLSPPDDANMSRDGFRLLYLIRLYASSTSNSYVREVIPTLDRGCDSSVVKLFNCMLHQKVVSYELSCFMLSHIGFARKLLSVLTALAVSPDDIVRMWSIRALWFVVPMFQEEEKLSNYVAPGGFYAYARESLFGTPLTESNYIILMQIILVTMS
jgi:hypothetical protein